MRKERNSGEIRSFEKERESGVVFSEFHVKCEIGGRGRVEMEYTIRVCLLTMYNRTKYGKSVEKGRSWLFVSNIRYSYMLYTLKYEFCGFIVLWADFFAFILLLLSSFLGGVKLLRARISALYFQLFMA